MTARPATAAPTARARSSDRTSPSGREADASGRRLLRFLRRLARRADRRAWCTGAGGNDSVLSAGGSIKRTLDVLAAALLTTAVASAQSYPDDSGAGTRLGIEQLNTSGQVGEVTLFRAD